MGATLGRKMSKRLSWPIWADFGQARDAQNGDKMAELGAKMGPRWRQDVQDGACLAILRPIGESSWAFWGSWGRSFQKWLKYKNEHHYSVLATFSGLGGSGWRLSGLSWGILARSWAILGDLGVKLGPYGSMLEERWRRRAKITKLDEKWVTQGNEGCFCRGHLSARREVPRA